jgi:Protein of Unknown function (DUF2784)
VYGVLADAVAVLHFAFLAFVVLGGFLAWRWPWVIWAHLVAAGWGALITVFSMNCPLTHVENELRVRVGEPELAGGFIDTYVEGVIYPERYINEVRALAGVVVLVSWLGLVERRRRRAQQPLVEHHRHG